MIRNKILIVITTLFATLGSFSQTVREISLEEALVIARLQSVDAAVALNELKTAYWEYRTFRADLLPEVNFTGTLPTYSKSYSSYQQADGSYTFVRNNNLGLSGKFSVDQNIWLTGGQLSVTSSVDYIKQLGAGGMKQFMTVPVGLQFSQPIFGVNSVKWDRRIEPVRYQEAKAAYASATEDVNLKTINSYFNLLMAKEALEVARQNMDNAEHLHKVAVARREMGQISENELLQLQLAALTAQATLTNAESNLNARMFNLRAHLGMNEDEVIVPVMPDGVPDIRMEYDRVLSKALENNSFILNIRRRQLQADYEVAIAKGNRRSIDLFASVGFTGLDHQFTSAYQDLMDNQVVQVGVKIPILDWGKRKGKVKVAQSNREVVLSRIKQEELNFSQDIFLLTANFNNQAEQLNIAREADRIAQKRYQTSVEAFLIGKINTLDLADAQSSKDDARNQLINELFYFWYYYYNIRSLTLWDFNAELPIEFDEKELVK